jgi:hypothetical protein
MKEQRIFYADNGRSYEMTADLVDRALELMSDGMVGAIVLPQNRPADGLREVRLGAAGSIMVKDLSVS